MRIPKTEIQYQIRLVLNGPAVNDSGEHTISTYLSSIAECSPNFSFAVQTIPEAGKIKAVNSVIRSSHIDGLVVVDDDIILPSQAFAEIDRYLRAKHQHFEALCFTKTPLYSGTPTTTFLSDIQFLLHPSVQRLLVRARFFQTYRPTGSLYAIHSSHLRPFPDPCNEADVLVTKHIKISNEFVRTWYPDSFAEEVSRRSKHKFNIQAAATGMLTKPLESLSSYQDFSIRERNLPPAILSRIAEVLNTMEAVMIQAELQVRHAQHP